MLFLLFYCFAFIVCDFVFKFVLFACFGGCLVVICLLFDLVVIVVLVCCILLLCFCFREWFDCFIMLELFAL